MLAALPGSLRRVIRVFLLRHFFRLPRKLPNGKRKDVAIPCGV